MNAKEILRKHLPPPKNEAEKNDDINIINAMEEYRNQPTPFTPPRTPKEEADRLVDEFYLKTVCTKKEAAYRAVICYTNTITALELRGIHATYEKEVLTILKG